MVQEKYHKHHNKNILKKSQVIAIILLNNISTFKYLVQNKNETIEIQNPFVLKKRDLHIRTYK